MSPRAWVALALLAVLLDLAMVGIMRLRRGGAQPAPAAPRPRIPRPLPPLLLLAGAALLFLGQSLETPGAATGGRTVSWLAAVGVVAVIAGGLLLPTVVSVGRDQSTQKGPAGIAARTEKTRLRAPTLELAALLLGSIVLLFLGSSMSSYLFESERGWIYVYSAAGLGGFILAALGFSGRGLPRWAGRTLGAAANRLGVTEAQVVLLLLAPFLGLSAWLAAGDSMLMRRPAIAVLSWLAGILCVVLGGLNQPLQLKRRLKFTPPVLALGGLFLAAFLLRGLATAQIPWLFTGDEASAGLSAAQFIDGTRNNLFGVAWFSFPSLFFYVQSLSIRIFGQNVEALRIASALAGALTVPATFALANELFDRRVAWASAAYLAVFHFHIHFSRIGLNNIWDGFFMAAFAAAFWHAWKSDRRLSYAAAGIVLGLSQYFYVSIRVVMPLLLLWLAAAGIKDWRQLRERVPGLAIMLMALLVTAMPLAIFFLRHPQEFGAPLGRVAALGPWLQAEAQNTGRATWEVMLQQFRTAALGFTSANLRLAYEPGQPMLLALPATLFLMGIGLIVVRIRELRSIWLALWLLAAVFVGALSLSPPASQRYVLVAPAVAILVGLPLVTVVDWVGQLWPKWRRAALGGALVVLALASWSDLSFYFWQYTTGNSFGDINTEAAQALAEMLATEDPETFVYFLGGRMGFRSHSNIPYLAPQVTGQDLPQPLVEPLTLELHPHTLFVLLPEREAELALIEAAYPGGTTFQRQGRHELLYIGYEIGGS